MHFGTTMLNFARLVHYRIQWENSRCLKNFGHHCITVFIHTFVFLQVKELSWIPYPLPPKCRIIISSHRSDLTAKQLSARPDVELATLPVMSDVTSRRNVIERYLTPCEKFLNESQWDKIMRSVLSSIPLFLTLLAKELRRHIFKNAVDEFLDSCLRVKNIREFNIKIILLWIKEFSHTKEGENSEKDGEGEKFNNTCHF